RTTSSSASGRTSASTARASSREKCLAWRKGMVFLHKSHPRAQAFSLNATLRLVDSWLLDGRVHETVPLSHGERKPGRGGAVGGGLRVPRGRGARPTTGRR